MKIFTGEIPKYPQDTKDILWHFVGMYGGKSVELIVTSYDDEGCHEAAHYHNDMWAPTTFNGAKYLLYNDMQGEWQQVVISNQCVEVDMESIYIAYRVYVNAQVRDSKLIEPFSQFLRSKIEKEIKDES